jgi:hypothetical protein
VTHGRALLACRLDLLAAAAPLITAAPARAAVYVIHAAARAFPSTAPRKAPALAVDAAGASSPRRGGELRDRPAYSRSTARTSATIRRMIFSSIAAPPFLPERWGNTQPASAR